MLLFDANKAASHELKSCVSVEDTAREQASSMKAYDHDELWQGSCKTDVSQILWESALYTSAS